MEKDSIFSSQEFEQAYQEIKNDVIDGKSGVEQPVAIVLGGQPGAGKSNLYIMASERFDGNIVALDCDIFRENHPESEKPVPMFSRAGQKAFAEKAAERAAARPQQIEKKNELEK